MKKIICLVSIFLFVLNGSVVHAEKNAVDLLKIWALAEINMPSLKARAKELEAIRHSLRALPKWYVPELHTEFGYSAARTTRRKERGPFSDTASQLRPPERSRDFLRHGPLARVVARWTVWDGGRTGFRRLLGKKQSEAARWKQALVVMALKKRLSLTYFEIAYLKELNIIYLDQSAEYRRLSRSLRRRLRIGAIGRSDLEDVIVRLLRLGERIELQKKTTAILEERLFVLSGQGAESDLSVRTLSNLLPPGGERNPKNTAFASLPAYRLAKAVLNALEAKKFLAARNLYWPSLSVEIYGGYGPHRDAIQVGRPEAGIGFAFRFPLYSTRDRAALLRAREAKIEAAKLDVKQQLLAARLEFNEKIHEIRRDRAGVVKLKSIITRSSRNLRRAHREFARGIKAPADMVATIGILFSLREQYARLRARLLLRQTELFLLSQPPGSKEADRSGKK